MAEQPFGAAYSGQPPANYERYFVPAIGAPLAEELIDVAALAPGERVLDVACGTGVVARLAARAVGESGSVAGLDANPGMLAIARSVAPPEPAIEWHEASADAMPFPDASYDVVLCQMGLQFMPDRPGALREMHRVMTPGGRLVFNVTGPTPRLFTIMGEALARHIGAEPAGFVGQIFSLHDTNGIQNIVDGAAFDDVSVESDTKHLGLPEPAEFLWQYIHSTPLAGAVAQADDATRQAFEDDVVAQWEEFVEDGSLMLDVRVVVATAQK